MATTTWWFVVFPASENPGNTFPAHAQIVSAQQGSPAYNAWTANGAYTIAGVSWQVDAGPFPTQKQAQDWAPQPLTIVDWVGAAVAGVLVGAGNQSPSTAVPEGQAAASAVTDPLTGVAGALEAFYQAITDGKTWRSIGWLLLGILLMIVGVALWIGPSAARRNPIGIAAEQLG
jgi:hypothetical protein